MTISSADIFAWWLILSIVASPIAGLAALGFTAFGSRRLRERRTHGVVMTIAVAEVLSTIGLVVCAFILGERGRHLPSVQLPFFSAEGSLSLMADLLSLPFLVMTAFLSSVVALFALNYLRGEPGYLRFFILYLMFVLGMQIIFLGGSFEVIFIGWELIGLTSALLISFFFTSPQAVENALRAFWAYRLTDIGLLLGAVMLAHAGHEGRFLPVTSIVGGVDDPLMLDGWRAYLAAFLIILPALGKSAQIPFSEWLPRAMEGPTPSSAIFYGALSVHAGVFLCLCLFAEAAVPMPLLLLLIVIGLLTTAYATLLGNIQADIKGRLAYASMAQVGLMMVEAGLGLRWLVIVHFIGHSTLRTYQLLYAQSWVHEHQEIWRPVENEPMAPGDVRTRFFRLAFNLAQSGGWGRFNPVDLLERAAVVLKKGEARLRKSIIDLTT
jgi:NAD(P)H-quinone oxidoreductase subunit 5